MGKAFLTNIYYLIKPLISRRTQLFLRRKMVMSKRRLYQDIWPIDEKAGTTPDGWKGWPENRKFSLVLTHDVDTETGQKKCNNLMQIEKELGFRSSFNFVPERYKVSAELRKHLCGNGFEVGVHGLNHDGKLYKNKFFFNERSIRINHYLKKWGASGFRSPAMHYNLEWIHNLNILYDASTFDTDPFEPLPEGMRTIFPFWVSNHDNQNGYVELPYTLPQDFTLFILMQERSIDIWKMKLDWIARNGGMALINTHPDYMNFGDMKMGLEEYPVEYYVRFLEYVAEQYEGQYWHVLPKDMSLYWMKNNVK